MKPMALILTSVLFSQLAVASGPACAEIFRSATAFSAQDVDKIFVDLALLRSQIDQAKANGDKSTALVALESDYVQKEEHLVQSLIQNKVMTRDEVIARFRQEMLKLQEDGNAAREESARLKAEEARRKEAQAVSVNIAVIDGTRSIFRKISSGSFMMGNGGSQVPVILTRPFQLEATPTTQIVWKTVAELANSHLGGKYHIDADPSVKKGGTIPVNNITPNEIVSWINALNELSILDVPELKSVLPQHQKGDRYRLPTDAEWEFVASGRGQFEDGDPWGRHGSMYEYAWLDRMNNDVQPVAQKKAVIVEGQEFYDQFGNVQEVVQDGYLPNPKGGTDPFTPVLDKVTVRGGSVASRFTSSATKSAQPLNERLSYSGFRLAKDVAAQEK